MILKWYPSYLENDPDSDVRSFIRKDLAKYRELQVLVESFLGRVMEVSDLQPFFDSKQIAPLGADLFEMRIPKTRRGGVVRIYFCRHPGNKRELILLDAELKHEKAPARTATATSKKECFMKSFGGLEK